jgi:L-aminopeptidase/D-esterase-like protein
LKQFSLTDFTGAAAYAKRFQPLIEQGLVGAGTIAPMSQFQQGVGTQLAGMTMPDQFALAEQTGQAVRQVFKLCWVCKLLL